MRQKRREKRTMPNFGMLLKFLPIVALTVGSIDSSDGKPSRTGCRKVDSSLNLTGIGFGNVPEELIKKNILTKLILDKNQIKLVSSESFSSAPKLTHLSLANNQLSSLDLEPFSKLPNLKTLILNGNCRSPIDSRYLARDETSFRYSYYSRDHSTPRYDHDNRLCYLEVNTVLPSLTHLYVENNTLQQISAVGTGELPSLTHLHLSYNPYIINLIDIFEINKIAPALTHLYLQHCNITRYDPSQPPTVTSLYLDWNRFDSIHNEYCYNEGLNLRWAPQLEILSVSHNLISRINNNSFENTVDLVTLDLSYNQISSIDGIFDQLISLKHLNLENNRIRHIDRDAFKYTTNLITLDLSHNRISQIGINIFDKLQMLEYLDLETNFLNRSFFASKRLFCGFTKLTTLALGYNDIREIHADDFRNMLQLKTLSLNNNSISNIEPNTFSNLTKLEELSLAENLIRGTRLMLISRSLVTLNLDKNRIRSIEDISLTNVSNLALLSLKNNHVTSITTKWFVDAPENLTIVLGYDSPRENREVSFRKSSVQTMNNRTAL